MPLVIRGALQASHPHNEHSGYARQMLSWIWIPALYVLAFGLLAWLGGISAASDAIARWGRETAQLPQCVASPCS